MRNNDETKEFHTIYDIYNGIMDLLSDEITENKVSTLDTIELLEMLRNQFSDDIDTLKKDLDTLKKRIDQKM